MNKSHLRFTPSRLIGATLIVVAVLLSMAFAGAAPSPRATLILDPGLNIVTAEPIGMPRLRAWLPTGAESYGVSWTEGNVTASTVVLADVDHCGANEVVVYNGCGLGTRKNPINGYFINAYKQGVDGVYYSSYYDSNSFVLEQSTSRPDLAVFDFEGDGYDEIILGTTTHIAIFHFVSDATGNLRKTYEADLNALGVTIAPKPLARKGLAVGDVDGHLENTGAGVEIVCMGSYVDGGTKSSLLVFDQNLGLKWYNPLHQTDSRLPDFVINNVRIANTNADATNEIWCSGWTNDFSVSPARYHQQVLSWTVASNDGDLNPGPYLDLGWQTSLGPDISAGKLMDLAGPDQIILNNSGKPGIVDIYRNDGYDELALVTSKIYAPDEIVHLTQVAEGRLFVCGNQVYTEQVKEGKKWVTRTHKRPFIDVLEIQSGVLAHLWKSNELYDGNEIWGFAVGRGTK